MEYAFSHKLLRTCRVSTTLLHTAVHSQNPSHPHILTTHSPPRRAHRDSRHAKRDSHRSTGGGNPQTPLSASMWSRPAFLAPHTRRHPSHLLDHRNKCSGLRSTNGGTTTAPRTNGTHASTLKPRRRSQVDPSGERGDHHELEGTPPLPLPPPQPPRRYL